MDSFDYLSGLAEKYGDIQRLIFQLLVRHGALSVDTLWAKFLEYVTVCEKETAAEYATDFPNLTKEQTELLLLKLLTCMNTAICKMKFRITRMDDEFRDDGEYIVLVNEMRRIDSLLPAAEFTLEEMMLFRAWLNAICTDHDGEIGEIEALNATSDAGGKVTKKRAEEIIERMAAQNWLIKIKRSGRLTLGVRAVAELESHLTSEFNLTTCVSCRHCLFYKRKAVHCKACHSYYHRQCVRRLFAHTHAKSVRCAGRVDGYQPCTATVGRPDDDADMQPRQSVVELVGRDSHTKQGPIDMGMAG